MTTDRTSHYIRPLRSSTFPKRYVYLDTESIAEQVSDDEQVQTFRIASMSTDRWSDRHATWISQGPLHFTSAEDIWRHIDKFAIASTQTVLWCHNLGYDLRISQAMTILPEMGWQFDTVRLTDDMAWCRVIRPKDGARLLMCDTFAWVPARLENIATMMGQQKEPLPANDDDDIDAWFARCDRDVEILADAWRMIHAWMQGHDLGPWRVSGAAQAWTIWRKHFYTHQILVHDDADGLDAERTAAYAGRAEAFRNGKVTGRLVEMDYRHSYASTCSVANVPTRRLSPFLDHISQTDRVYAYLEERESAYVLGCEGPVVGLVRASVEVACGLGDVPVLPYRVTGQTTGKPGRVVWPTGKFEGVWWAPELLAAEQAGQLRRLQIHSVSWYKCEPALKEWSEWAIGLIDSPHTHPLIAAIVKQFSRTIIGRFGMRFVDYEQTHLMPVDDVSAGYWVDGNDSTESARRMMQIGRQVYVSNDPQEGADSCPQVMSYVMMLTRLRLLRAIQAAGGAAHVVYCDTDGLIVDREGAARLKSFVDVIDGSLRPKAHYSRMTLLGPKQIIVDGKPRVAGLPSKPIARNRDGSWTVERWERTWASIESGRPNEVRVHTLKMHLTGSNGRRKIKRDSVMTDAISIDDIEEVNT